MIIKRYVLPFLALGMLACGAVHAASPAETAAGVMRTLGAEKGDGALNDVYLQGKRSLALALADICREGRVELRHLPLLETALECLPADRRRESAALAARLLAAGANPNGAEDDGAPLCIAVEQGNTEVFHLLRSAGARLDVKDSLGHSLLYLAAQHHNTEMLAALLEAGLQPERTPEGYTLLHIAISPPEQEDCCCGSSMPDEAAVIATCQLLIQRGADVNAAAKDGCTPLLWNMCEYASWPGIVRLLLANGADANARDAAGNTALDYALRGEEADSCRLLLEAGAKLGKGSPLQLAVLLGDEAEVRRLLPGAPPLSEDERPLLLTAMRARQWGVCRVLMEAAGEIKFTQTLAYVLGYMGRNERRSPVPHDFLELLAQHMSPADGLRLAVKTGDAELCRKCLQRGADGRDIKLLNDAVQEGNTEIARLLIEKGADVNGADDRGFTPLYRAAWHGGAEMVRLLLAAGANPNGVEAELVEQRPGQSSVFSALIGGAVRASSAEPRKKTVHYYPLLAAMCSGSEEVRLLLDAAAEPGLNSPEVLSVLSGVVQDHVMYICSDTEVLKLLLDRGLSLRGNRSVLQSRGMRFGGALQMIQQDIDMLELLQAAGAQLDDWSPLHLEVYLNRPEKCRRLLADGADVNAQDAKGDTPLMVAVKLGRESLIGLLLAAGARADLPNKEGVTPINADLSGYSTSMTSCLLEAGALKDPHTPEAQEALHRMSRYGRESAVYGLLRAGVDPNARDDEGRTPLHTIATEEYSYASPLAVRLLLAYGADPQAKDAEGRTPAQLAEENDTLAPAVRKLLNKHTNNE